MLNVIWVLFLIPVMWGSRIRGGESIPLNSMGIIFNTRVVWVESCCWLVCAHNNAGINFNTRVARGAVVLESLS